MKKFALPIIAAVATILWFVTASPALAAGKEITVTGEGVCAKCALKESKTCQTVVEVDKDGKKVKYYIVANDVAKKFHENVCEESKKVTATGTVKEVDGKMEMTPTKIELASK